MILSFRAKPRSGADPEPTSNIFWATRRARILRRTALRAA